MVNRMHSANYSIWLQYGSPLTSNWTQIWSSILKDGIVFLSNLVTGDAVMMRLPVTVSALSVKDARRQSVDNIELRGGRRNGVTD